MTGVLADMLHQLWITVSKLGPVEIIDVVVVTFFLYQLLRLVKGTQATQLLLGLIVLGILGFLSVQLHLVLLSWLFQNAASVIAIALIVLFQPELRRMLDQLRRVPTWAGRWRGSTSSSSTRPSPTRSGPPNACRRRRRGR